MTVRIRIHDGPLPREISASNSGVEGALLLFEGIVRRMEDGRPLAGLRYEVYSPMAEKLLEETAESLIEKFGVTQVEVEHSRGFVPVGQCSFRLLVQGVHRQEVFQAAEWFIERLKRDVPIWKHPVFDEKREHTAFQ